MTAANVQFFRSSPRGVRLATAFLLVSLLACPYLFADEPAPLSLVERFMGIAQLPRDPEGFAAMRAAGAGWQRDDVNWGNTDRVTEQDVTLTWMERHITAAQSAGVKVLPILDYMPEWLAAVEDWEWTYAGVRKVVNVTPDENERSGYKRHLTEYDAATGEKISEYDISPGFCPPRDSAKWAAIVEKTVAHFSKPPYDVRYFQIWNEATPLTGPFWNGSIERYVDEVHIPAAKAIRKHGGKVVWGGWPDCNTLAEYDEALAYHDAWKVTDILDVHYLYPAAFEYLWRKWVNTGKCEGIWMTEIGDSAHGTDIIPNQYPRMIYWALNHGWSKDDPDKYKVFFFSWDYMTRTTPEALRFDARPTQAARMTQIARLLGGETLAPFDDFSTAPAMTFSLFEQDASVEGFRSGENIVIAFHIPQTYAAHDVNRETLDSNHMGFPRRRRRYAVTLKGMAGAPVAARLHAIDADPRDLPVETSGGDLVARFCPPARAGLGERRYVLPVLVFYIEVAPRQP